MSRFLQPAAFVYAAAWREFHDDKAETAAERWRRRGTTIEQAWLKFMQAVLCPASRLLLALFVERLSDRREAWIKPGGYFYTRAGNKRKRLREKLRPRFTVTADDKLAQAQEVFHESLALHGEGFERRLLMVFLAMSGAITGGKPGDRRMSARRRPKVYKKRFRLWTRSVYTRLRALEKDGVLQRPR